MKQRSLHIATIMIMAFMVIGVTGVIRSQSLQPSWPSLDRIASFLSGPALSRLHFEIAGSHEPIETTLRSQKTLEGIDAEPKVIVSEGTSPQDVVENEVGDIETADVMESNEEEEPGSLTDNKIAFIYHSHNRESWLPELQGKQKPGDAFDGKINVTLLGERLEQKLKEGGVGAVRSEKDYHSAVPSFNYNYSYKYSLTTVREAMAVHPSLVYLFDIHRDSQPRARTTTTIDGKDYAKLFFIIGEGNENWAENEAFAQEIHKGLEKKFPGLSKGILSKGAKHGHGEYNQSLSPSSVLIEIGGVDNTLEESYRTVDALASVLTEVIRRAEKAGASPPADSSDLNPA